MIVFLTEEPSMKVTIEELFTHHFPALLAGVDYQVLAFRGKHDLEKNITPKMRGWSYGEPVFVILRDADGGDCLQVKTRLEKLASSHGKPFKIRVVCQELESWFIGDREAVIQAYPNCSFPINAARFRNPDSRPKPSQDLSEITGDFTKVARAQVIAQKMVLEGNRSRSFQVFVETMKRLVGEIS